MIMEMLFKILTLMTLSLLTYFNGPSATALYGSRDQTEIIIIN